jgi:signal transduction histidine kinase
MRDPAGRLVARLIVMQVAVTLATELVVVAFAPRLLLLDSSVVLGSLTLVTWGGAAMLAYAALVGVVLTRGVRPALRALSAGSNEVSVADILGLYDLPARLVLADLVGAALLCAAAFVPQIRPTTNDLSTQIEIALLTMTMASVAALPTYVMMRASVARVLELVPVEVSREAIDFLTGRKRDVGRVRYRLFAAVVAPVAFVAFAASLLVHAHLRAFDTSAREQDAMELAEAAFQPLGGRTDGRKEAGEEARANGFAAELSYAGAARGVVHNDEGQTIVTVPLTDGHVTLRFDTARVSAVSGVYILIALIATAIAGLLGARLGGAFAQDVLLATREVQATGAVDVIKGTRIQRDARFHAVVALRSAMDELGGVFREFASAQERAIEARTSTERMRGLFLASMSHDLKAPLNATLGFAELVKREPLTEGQRESATIIEQRGRELLHLIDTILDAARAEAGELAIAAEWTRVGDVVMPAVLDARELTEGTGVKVIGEIQPGVPRILVDAGRVTQALTAIILVAVRFAEQGIVRVRATLPAAGERLRIDVESTGRGLPPAERDKIFEAFKHTDRARRHGSLGLGPSLARTIIERHGGVMGVEATEGGGTAFHVWVPTERMSTRALPENEPVPEADQTRRNDPALDEDTIATNTLPEDFPDPGPQKP